MFSLPGGRPGVPGLRFPFNSKNRKKVPLKNRGRKSKVHREVEKGENLGAQGGDKSLTALPSQR